MSSSEEKARLRGYDNPLEPTSDVDVLHARLDNDPRFNPPTPSIWKRVALLSAIVIFFWVAYSIRPAAEPAPTVVHANRYSKEYKFRPAASPVITEKLKDGRVRVRGAQPTFR